MAWHVKAVYSSIKSGCVVCVATVLHICYLENKVLCRWETYWHDSSAPCQIRLRSGKSRAVERKAVGHYEKWGGWMIKDHRVWQELRWCKAQSQVSVVPHWNIATDGWGMSCALSHPCGEISKCTEVGDRRWRRWQGWALLLLLNNDNVHQRWEKWIRLQNKSFFFDDFTSPYWCRIDSLPLFWTFFLLYQRWKKCCGLQCNR